MWLTETKAQQVPKVQNVYQSPRVRREGAERPLWVEKEDSLQGGSGPQVGLLELCIDIVYHDCTL